MRKPNLFKFNYILSLSVFLFATLSYSEKIEAAPFSFVSKSFEISGNLSSNPIDEFDNGVIAPWTTEGTVNESGGVVTFQNPGLEINGVRNGVAIGQQTSRIRLQPIAQDPFFVAEGSGDFFCDIALAASASRAKPKLWVVF